MASGRAQEMKGDPRFVPAVRQSREGSSSRAKLGNCRPPQVPQRERVAAVVNGGWF